MENIQKVQDKISSGKNIIFSSDDPVGAVSVHLICGIWGTLAVGIFSADKSFATQLIGVLGYGVTCFVLAFIIFQIINAIIGVRVSEQEEIKGLDLSEHEMESYSGFQVFTAE